MTSSMLLRLHLRSDPSPQSTLSQRYIGSYLLAMHSKMATEADKRRSRFSKADDVTRRQAWSRKPSAAAPDVQRASRHAVTSEEILSGGALRKVATTSVAYLGSRLQLPETLTVAGACSGSGMDDWISHELEFQSQSTDFPTQVDVLFRCEMSPMKQQWLKETRPPTIARPIAAAKSQQGSVKRMKGKAPCLFRECGELGQGVAYCSEHDRHCKICRAVIFTAGFSCKAVSRQNSHRTATGSSSCLSATESDVSTRTTYDGIKAHS